jgi:hypothetical protein
VVASEALIAPVAADFGRSRAGPACWEAFCDPASGRRE